MTSEKVTAEQVAPILGISPTEIRLGVKHDRFAPPIGRKRKSRSGKHYRYDIYKHLVMEYAGLKEWPE